MILQHIFKNPVDRPIEGVIKADDEASLRLEIEEYVLTNEVANRLDDFLDAYNKYEGANGVWVSGFFGSGKSHLLKMLALLLENRQIDGASTLELFLPKCGDNEILRADLKKAVAIPSRSILFNIDQKADVISKTQIDALLAVFVKVFDEMCGYYGKQGHIAQFERDLDSRDLYEPFKSAYATIAGRPWERGREQALLENKNIARAYAQVSGGDESQAAGILEKYRSQYKVSIEDFAEQVHAYIQQQEAGFRLNFFVDEVGQYIADNVKLMTNLQTIAESLATKCRGRAWVIVTAQEDMTSVVGEMTKRQGNDFSKIQARFKNRMKLTSADVAEVIQKRLLTKNDEGVEQLGELFHQQANNLKTLFDFSEGSRPYHNFQDRDHFIHSYPFIPYQFALFQSVIKGLSDHNAFEGKHSSVGERSMLGVFQQVAIRIAQHEIGQLATFDLMFEGIRTALKSQTQQSVLLAEKHLDNKFAVKLLKTLLLVKYVKDFKPTVRNLCVLMLDSFDTDLGKLKTQIEEALNLLEQQTYVQRKGEYYEYLTDKEKDVEQEIKNTEVETADVAGELEKTVFDNILKLRKIRYEQNGQDYTFSRKLDDHFYGREHELTIHIISPFHENTGNEELLKMQSMGRDELLVLLPADDRLMRDLVLYKKTEKYIRQNISTTQEETLKRILAGKGEHNRERETQIKQRVQWLLGQAKFFLAGAQVEVAGEDAQIRIVRGFQELVTRVYPNLGMLGDVDYSESGVATRLKKKQEGLFGNDVAALPPADQEMVAFIGSNKRVGIRTTLKNLIEKFERKPYGWPYAAILCTLANLCARGKVEVRLDGNLLDNDELAPVLCNSKTQANVVLEPQADFTPAQIRALKEFLTDFFNEPVSHTEAKALGQHAGDKFNELRASLNLLRGDAAVYPFVSEFNAAYEKISRFGGKPYDWYLSTLGGHEDELYDLKEKVLDPVRQFLAGPQKTIYDDAQQFVQQNAPNFAYIEGEEAQQIEALLADAEVYKGNRPQQLKALTETLKQKVSAQITDEFEKARVKTKDLQSKLAGLAEYIALCSEQQKKLNERFEDFTKRTEQQQLIAVTRDSLRQFEDSDYQQMVAQIAAWSQPEPSVTSQPELGVAAVPAPEMVALRSLTVPYTKAWLADEADVEKYVELLRVALLEEIKEGKRIQI